MKIGSVIKKCRKLRNMTQLQVSALADVSETHIEEAVDLPESESISTNLGSLLKNIKL